MSNEHRIHTVLDMLALSPEEFARMVPDLCAWYSFNKEIEHTGAAKAIGFSWVDDGKTGEIHSVVVKNAAGEEQTIKGTAYQESQ